MLATKQESLFPFLLRVQQAMMKLHSNVTNICLELPFEGGDMEREESSEEEAD